MSHAIDRLLSFCRWKPIENSLVLTRGLIQNFSTAGLHSTSGPLSCLIYSMSILVHDSIPSWILPLSWSEFGWSSWCLYFWGGLPHFQGLWSPPTSWSLRPIFGPCHYRGPVCNVRHYLERRHKTPLCVHLGWMTPMRIKSNWYNTYFLLSTVHMLHKVEYTGDVSGFVFTVYLHKQRLGLLDYINRVIRMSLTFQLKFLHA